MVCAKYGVFTLSLIQDDIMYIFSNDESSIDDIVEVIERVFPLKDHRKYTGGLRHGLQFIPDSTEERPNLEAYYLAIAFLLDYGWEPFQIVNEKIWFRKCTAYKDDIFAKKTLY